MLEHNQLGIVLLLCGNAYLHNIIYLCACHIKLRTSLCIPVDCAVVYTQLARGIGFVRLLNRDSQSAFQWTAQQCRHSGQGAFVLCNAET